MCGSSTTRFSTRLTPVERSVDTGPGYTRSIDQPGFKGEQDMLQERNQMILCRHLRLCIAGGVSVFVGGVLAGLLFLAMSQSTFSMQGADDQNAEENDLRSTIRRAIDDRPGLQAEEGRELKALLRGAPPDLLDAWELIPLYVEEVLMASRQNRLFVKSRRIDGHAVILMPDRYAADIGLSAALVARDGQRLAEWELWQGYFVEGDPPYPDEVHFPLVPVQKVSGASGLRLELSLPKPGGDQMRVAMIPLYPSDVEE